ncbi:MAG: ABC transporter ATP-binding protein [Bacteroidales bacterium]|nr:ABC transporter ATP-binding protein [Bacteroidales bacterium]
MITMSATSFNSPAISARNLTRDFGKFRAVDSLNFEINKDEIFGFLGPNGAGKTTSINMICGLSPATSGEVEIFGQKLRDNRKIRGMIGICPQENIFWPRLTCREQLLFIGEMYELSAKKSRERTDMLLDLLGLAEKRNTLASRLSGGMKRRLSICLALVHDPSIVVLDEPEAGLDPQSRILVREFIRLLAREKTILLTTHNMDEADRLADRVAIIDKGKLLMLDTPANLKKSIGTGDVLEIVIEEAPEEALKKTESDLSAICRQVMVTGMSLMLKANHIIAMIPSITEIIKGNNLVIREIRLRENTLEDVFIHLTGKKLRQ